MNLYIVRHAEALPVGGTITRDADRRLSPRGEDDAALIGRALAHLDRNVEIIVTSPLARAIETGEIIGKEISDHPIMYVSKHLSPGNSHNALFRELLSLGAGANIIAVGHQPDMSGFISFLIVGNQEAAVAMSAGSIAKLVLEGSRPQAHLSWLLTPDAVKSLSTGP
jgi:phosphohistidine phosphatase